MSGEINETWNVIVLGFDAPEDFVVDGLQRVFGVDVETAQRLVRSTPRAVKHDVPGEVALWYGQALAEIGGRYELQPSGDAFVQTSAGEHVSPTLRRASSAVPEHLEVPGQIGAEFTIGDDQDSGLAIDTARAQRKVTQGHGEAKESDEPTARASMSSFPAAPSQSLPPPRMGYVQPPPPKPQRSPATGGWLLAVLGVALFAVGVIFRADFTNDLAIASPLLKVVGALLLVRGAWTLFTK